MRKRKLLFHIMNDHLWSGGSFSQQPPRPPPSQEPFHMFCYGVYHLTKPAVKKAFHVKNVKISDFYNNLFTFGSEAGIILK